MIHSIKCNAKFIITQVDYKWVDLSSILIKMIMQLKILIVLLLISLSLTHKHYKCVFE